MKNKIKYIIAGLTVLLFCGWYDPVLDLFTNATTATIDMANDWILFQDVTDGKKKKAHPSELGDNLGNYQAIQALDMNSFAVQEVRNITGSDLLFVASDSARFEGDNSYWELNTGFTRLNVAGTNVLAWNNTDRTGIQLVPDNTAGAYSLSNTDGSNYITITTTNAAPRMVLGSSEAGAAVGFQGIRYEDVQAITSSGSFTATKSTITVNLASTATVTADVTGWPNSASVGSIFTIINTDAVGAGVDVTVSLTGATWHSGADPVLTPGQSVNAKLINGVLYPL